MLGYFDKDFVATGGRLTEDIMPILVQPLLNVICGQINLILFITEARWVNNRKPCIIYSRHKRLYAKMTWDAILK